MRITDIFFAVPGLILALAFVAALQAIDDFTLPLWFAFLLPLSGLCIYFRSSIFDTIMPGETSFPEGNLPLRIIVVVLLVALLALGGPWEDLFELADSSGWRIFASLIGLMIVGGIFILDRRLMDNISLDGVGGRTLNSLDWRNPYRYLTFRTLVIFIASIALFTWSGDADNEIVVIDNFDRLWKIQIALVFTGWPGYARLIRGQVLYVKEMTFVEAARSVGAPSGRIMFRHILPNAWAPLLVAFTLDIGGTILSASGLSFIGLGAEPGAAEWGKLVSDGRAHFPQDYWLVLFPGLAIAYTTLGFNLLGDGLRDVVDPKNRR